MLTSPLGWHLGIQSLAGSSHKTDGWAKGVKAGQMDREALWVFRQGESRLLWLVVQECYKEGVAALAMKERSSQGGDRCKNYTGKDKKAKRGIRGP